MSKYLYKIILPAFIVIFFPACNQRSNSADKEPSKKTIIIQPFAGFPESETKFIAAELKKLHPDILVKEPIAFPENMMNAAKTRYRADSLIRFLKSRTKDDYITIGLTKNDISTTKGKYADWGVFGLGYCPGKSCIVSLYRLKGNNKREKLFKVVIHELGHTEGLPHCPCNTCYMRDAEGKDRLNSLTHFCPDCRKTLTHAGWVLE